MNNRKAWLIIISLVLGSALISGSIVGFILVNSLGDTSSNSVPVVSAGSVSISGNSNYSRLYNNTIDSVVMIRTYQKNDSRGSVGSGFIYDKNGDIVTNKHVVGNSETVNVRFSNGEWTKGEVIGTDIYTDLAVVSVDPDNMPKNTEALRLANYNPNQGTHIAALGSPFGLEGSISSGIVSGVNRSMPTRRDFSIPASIQLDAPLNPGNSGGPLLNMNGAVVGVNRATQGDNVGFAISSLLVNRVVPKLIENGEYNHPFLGVITISVGPTVADVNEVSEASGVLVIDTVSGRPADGVLKSSTGNRSVNGRTVPYGGDIIKSINGVKIKDQQHLSRYLMLNTSPDENINITVLREGKRKTLSIELGERPQPHKEMIIG